MRLNVSAGRGEFESCPEGGCNSMQVVQSGQEAVLDVRVTFRNGGNCANQGITRLTVTRNGTDVVYTCSNETTTCNSNSRFRVVDGPGCTVDCKFYTDLALTDFTASDVGMYTVEVLFDRVRGADARSISRTFSLELSPSETSGGKCG
jgi:hypothetical protein